MRTSSVSRDLTLFLTRFSQVKFIEKKLAELAEEGPHRPCHYFHCLTSCSRSLQADADVVKARRRDAYFLLK